MKREWNPAEVYIPENWRDCYLTVQQVAALLGDSPKTVYNRNSRGDGPPFIRIGRKCKYSGKDLAEWIDRVGERVN